MTVTETAAIDHASEEATTGSLVAQPHWWRPPLRERTPRLKEADLHQREVLMIDYMVHGVDHVTLAKRILRNDEPIAIGEALTLLEAARLCRIKPRHARWLSTQPAFQRLLQRETIAFREGAKARAWRKIDALAHEPGDKSAAFAKVNLQAAAQITGETKQGGTSVTIHNTNAMGVSVKAGLVLRLPADAPAIPLEQEGDGE